LFHRIGRRLKLASFRLPALSLAGSGLILAILAGLILLPHMVAFANLADPAGLFGRLLQPLAQLAAGFGWTGAGFPAGLPYFALSLVLLAILPLFLGRCFCDRLCPAGILLRLAAAEPVGLRLGVAPEKCVSCGQCEKLCPTHCLDAKGKSLDHTRCVLCLDCLEVCKFSAVGWMAPAPEGRRRAIARLASLAAAGAFIASRRLAMVFSPPSAEGGLTPPGSRSPSRHKLLCVSCQACVPACPMRIVTSAGNPDARPVLDFDLGFCQYDCVACSNSCPAGAILPLPPEEKKRTRIAKTALLPERCLVLVKGTACGACAEVCPTHAVIMVRQEERGDLPTRPDFAPGSCIGCGACYHVCPAEPRAFRLEPLPRHEIAEEPRQAPEEDGPAAGPEGWEDGYQPGEFPF
jgi:formate hydrogenlyase subunit 6/NADH:ubiquinone oxidoreductase subunit I